MARLDNDVRLFQQAVISAPATNSFVFVVSNALEQFIGF